MQPNTGRKIAGKLDVRFPPLLMATAKVRFPPIPDTQQLRAASDPLQTRWPREMLLGAAAGAAWTLGRQGQSRSVRLRAGSVQRRGRAAFP